AFTQFSPLIGSLPSGTTDVGQKLIFPSSCSTPNTVDVEISGKVVAMLRDGTGSLIAGSAAQATLLITLECVTRTGVARGSDARARVVVQKERVTNVFKADSNITILKPVAGTPSSLSQPVGWTGCPTNNKGILSVDCAFPIGIVEFNNNNAIQNELPAAVP